jgi:hypothetical protein
VNGGNLTEQGFLLRLYIVYIKLVKLMYIDICIFCRYKRTIV